MTTTSDRLMLQPVPLCSACVKVETTIALRAFLTFNSIRHFVVLFARVPIARRFICSVHSHSHRVVTGFKSTKFQLSSEYQALSSDSLLYTAHINLFDFSVFLYFCLRSHCSPFEDFYNTYSNTMYACISQSFGPLMLVSQAVVSIFLKCFFPKIFTLFHSSLSLFLITILHAFVHVCTTLYEDLFAHRLVRFQNMYYALNCLPFLNFFS